jgi:hypothetical protein
MPLSSDSQVQFSVGDEVRLAIAVADLAGDAADPTEITLQVRDPSSTTTTYSYGAAEVTKSATGSYYYDLAVSSPGVYAFRWACTGAYVAAEAGSFSVVANPFA